MDNLVIFKKGDNVVLREAYRGLTLEVFEVVYTVPDLTLPSSTSISIGYFDNRVGDLGNSNQYCIRNILSPGRDMLYYQYQLQPFSEVRDAFIGWYEDRVKKLKKLI